MPEPCFQIHIQSKQSMTESLTESLTENLVVHGNAAFLVVYGSEFAIGLIGMIV